MKKQCGRRKLFIGGLISTFAPMAIQGLSALFSKNKRKRDEAELARQETQTQKLNQYISDNMALQTYDNLFNAASGGALPTGIDSSLASFLQAAQINGGAEMLNSTMAKMKGPSHAEDGIAMDANLDGTVDTEVEGNEVMEQERVYSNRLKPSKEFIQYLEEEKIGNTKGTYAQIAESLGKLKGKYETKLQEQVDEPAINTAHLMLEKVEEALSNLFLDQELSK